MAIKSAKPNRVLNPKFARPAGVISIELSAAGAVALVAYWLGHEGQPALATGLQLALAGLFAVAAAAGVQLLRGRHWAQEMLLGFWLFLALAGAVLAISAILYEVGSWWREFLDVSFAATITVTIAGSAVASVLLVLASASGSRLRYATLVTVSVAAAIALVLLVNIIAQADPIRRDVQTLGQFGLSQRSKEVLRSLDAEVRLTCIYTADDDLTHSKYRPRTLEYLNEMRETMRQLGGTVRVESVTTDAQKTALVARLREKISSGTSEHIRMLRNYQAQAGPLIGQLNAEANGFSQMPPDAYLSTWGMSAKNADIIRKMSDNIAKVSNRIESDLANRSGLPDTRTLIRQAIDSFDSGIDSLQTLAKQTDQIRQIPEQVLANRDDALASLDQLMVAADAMARTAGAVGDPIADTASEVIKQFIPQADRAAKAATVAAEKLEAMAGEKNASLLRQSPPWQIVIPVAENFVRRTNYGELMGVFAEDIARIKADAESLVAAAKEEHIAKVLPEWRKSVAQARANLETVADSIRGAIKKLTTVDPASQEAFAKLQAGSLFTHLIEPMQQWLDNASALGKLEPSTLTANITQDNIVIVEIADKIGVVQFDDIWPLKISSDDLRSTEQLGRNFNGDSAISAKILAMTNEPFATVVLTYLQPDIPAQMRPFVPVGMLPEMFKTLRARLEESNFEVIEWNLTEKTPPPATPGRQQVLLILPPAPRMQTRQPIPQFGIEHLERIRGAINDRGTPAIFLAQYMWPQPVHPQLPPMSLPYPFAGYLSEDWGIDVKSNLRLLALTPHPTLPGKFLLSRAQLGHLRLSDFTNHTAAKPLQAQRTLFNDLCPVAMAVDEAGRPKLPEGVTYEPLLQVRKGRRLIWASKRIMELVQQLRTNPDSTIEPSAELGDLPGPFDVAVAATRAATDDRPGARIVVLPMAMSLIDGYLDMKVPEGSNDAVVLTDPPRANADLVINSVCWLTGRQRYISRGPVRIKPVEMMSDATMLTLRWSVTLGAPLLVLLIGGAVMLLRRR